MRPFQMTRSQSMEKLLTVRRRTSKGTHTVLGAIWHYNSQNPGILPLLITAAIAGCFCFAASIMNVNSNQHIKDAAARLYVAGNSMAAFGAVGSIGAFIWGQVQKDEVPVPVLQDHGGALTKTWSENIQRRVQICTDGICSIFKWTRNERIWLPSSPAGASSSDTLTEEGFFTKEDPDIDLELGEPPQAHLQPPVVGWAVGWEHRSWLLQNSNRSSYHVC